MAHGNVKHDYHLVNPSPWPVVASIGALFSTALSVMLSLPSLRVSGDYLLIASIGFQLGFVLREDIAVLPERGEIHHPHLFVGTDRRADAFRHLFAVRL